MCEGFPVSEARRVSGKGFGVLGCCWVWGFGLRRNLHFNFQCLVCLEREWLVFKIQIELRWVYEKYVDSFLPKELEIASFLAYKHVIVHRTSSST